MAAAELPGFDAEALSDPGSGRRNQHLEVVSDEFGDRVPLGRRQDSRAGDVHLTETEQRIADLAAAGLTNRAIAEKLFLATKTVEVNIGRSIASWHSYPRRARRPHRPFASRTGRQPARIPTRQDASSLNGWVGGRETQSPASRLACGAKLKTGAHFHI